MSLHRTFYQFVIDEIPVDEVDEFMNFMDSFRDKTNCRWQYKKGKSIKFPLHIVPQKEDSILVFKRNRFRGNREEVTK